MEPLHFLSLFRGNFIIHKGKVKHSTPNGSHHLPNKHKMYEVRGTNEHNTKGVQVDVDVKQLHSLYCYVIVEHQHGGKEGVNGDVTKIVVWKGKLSNKYEQAAATQIANILKVKKVLFMQKA